MVCKYFLSFHRSPFHSVDCVRGCAEEPYLPNFAFFACAFGVISIKYISKTNAKKLSPYFFFFFLEALVSGLTFRSIIHFELTFVRVIRIQFYSFA